MSPIIYLAAGAAIGGGAAMVLCGMDNPHNWWGAVAGWIVGGAIYRWHWRNGQTDPKARRKIVAISLFIAVFTIAVLAQTVPDPQKSFEALAMFASSVAGIALSGAKRARPEQCNIGPNRQTALASTKPF